MKHLMITLAGALVLILCPHGAVSFDVNPIDVDCWGNVILCKLLKPSENLKFPVHETMTLLAYDHYESPDASSGGAAKTSADTLKKKGRLRDLVLGSEWNDDPDSLLRQGVTRAVQWYALFNDAKLQAECRKKPDDPKCKDKEIAQNPMMLYRSHFGDLQFLHSMASSDDEPAGKTKEKMMAWARFTYSIFIAGEVMDRQVLQDRNISWFADIDGIISKPGWTVGALFDPVPGGEWQGSANPLKYGHYIPSGKLRQQNAYEDDDDMMISVRWVALGSLLHMVQDSYSDSHTARTGGCNPIARSKGKITAFRNYTGQNTSDHGIADTHPDWLEHGDLKKNNPLWASAHLIQFAFNNVPWEQGVGKFLDEEVFPLADPSAMPQPGSKDCFRGM